MTFKFDNSMLEDGNCTAKALVRHLHGRAGKKEKTAADAGTAGHAFYEAFFFGGNTMSCLKAFNDKYAELIGTGADVEERLTPGNIRKILTRHAEARPYPEQWPFEVVELEQVKGVELEPGYEFYVKRDMLVKEKQTGLLAPCDHKSTGKITAWWTKKFKMTSQLSGYVWYTQQEHKNLGANAYINAVEFGKLPNSDRVCSTHRTIAIPGVQLGKKCTYKDCGHLHAKFELLIVSRNQVMLKAWKQNALKIAKKMEWAFNAFPDLEHLPFADTEGTFFDGCTFCEFVDLCRLGFGAVWTYDAEGNVVDVDLSKVAATVDDFTVENWWRPWDSATNSQGAVIDGAN